VKASFARTLLGRAVVEQAALERHGKAPSVLAAVGKAERAALAAAYAESIRRSVPAPTTAEVEGRYQARKADYVAPAGRRCWQLFARTEQGLSALAERVKAGEAFDKVASSNEDVQSAVAHGLVGVITDAELVELVKSQPAVASAISSTPPGTPSAPLKMRGGVGIIMCDARTDAKTTPLDDVRHQIAAQLLADKGSVAVRQRAEALRAKAKVELDEAVLAELPEPTSLGEMPHTWGN
jgi:parvulin-like peptidyl-prolyl isomerase